MFATLPIYKGQCKFEDFIYRKQTVEPCPDIMWDCVVQGINIFTESVQDPAQRCRVEEAQRVGQNVLEHLIMQVIGSNKCPQCQRH